MSSSSDIFILYISWFAQEDILCSLENDFRIINHKWVLTLKKSKEVDEFGSSGRKRPVEEGCVFQGDSYGRVSSGCDFNSGIEAFSTFINIY